MRYLLQVLSRKRFHSIEELLAEVQQQVDRAQHYSADHK